MHNVIKKLGKVFSMLKIMHIKIQLNTNTRINGLKKIPNVKSILVLRDSKLKDKNIKCN